MSETEKSAHEMKPLPPPEPKEKLVTVTINGNDKQIPKGKYVISDLKKVLEVDASLVLELVKEKKFELLDDAGHIEINGKEVFISHQRTGGSSSASA
jgi:hypothetical protein